MRKTASWHTGTCWSGDETVIPSQMVISNITTLFLTYRLANFERAQKWRRKRRKKSRVYGPTDPGPVWRRDRSQEVTLENFARQWRCNFLPIAMIIHSNSDEPVLRSFLQNDTMRYDTTKLTWTSVGALKPASIFSVLANVLHEQPGQLVLFEFAL